MPKTSKINRNQATRSIRRLPGIWSYWIRGRSSTATSFCGTHLEHAAGLRRYLENVALLEELAEVDCPQRRNASSSEDDESHPVPETLNHLRADAETSLKLAFSDGDQPDIPEEFGRYRIIRTLGKVRWAPCTKLTDTQLDRNVALKIPRFDVADREEMVQRFRREARAAADCGIRISVRFMTWGDRRPSLHQHGLSRWLFA